MGCGLVNVLMAMENDDRFTLRFFALLSFWSENHTPYHIDRGHSFDWKKLSRSVEAFSPTDVLTNVYKRMLRSRLPWQLDLFSSQTKTFVSEIPGRIRAWKQADSCSEDRPLAIQIGQCLLLVGFNGKFAFFKAGRCTEMHMRGILPVNNCRNWSGNSKNSERKPSAENTRSVRFMRFWFSCKNAKHKHAKPAKKKRRHRTHTTAKADLRAAAP